MMNVAVLLLFGSLLLIPTGLILLIPKSKRKTGKTLASLGLWFIIGAVVLAIWSGDDEAKKAGFENDREMKAAQAVGVSDPQVWRAKVDAQQAAEKEAAVRAKAEREAEAARAEAQRQANAARELERCKADLTCLGEKHSIRAGLSCREPVEKLAKYSFEWTDGWVEPKFSHYRWRSRKDGVITYIGDRIKFQNGFGAFQYHTYHCDFDTHTESVIRVTAEPGRM